MQEQEIRKLAIREVNKIFIPSVKPHLSISERLRYYDMYEEGIKKGIELCKKI